MTPEERKRQANRVQGLRNKRSGARVESRLDAAFDLYRRQGIADIIKTPEPMKVLRDRGGGRFTACFAKKGQADYAGTVRGGKSVYMEAKHTETDRIEKNRVTPEQSEFLMAHEKLGSQCYVLCGFGPSAVYRVPWMTWHRMKEIWGRLYVTEADLYDYKVMTQDGQLLILS